MRIKKISNKTLVVIHDLFIVAFVWEFTWLARFNFSQVNSTEWHNSLYLLPLVIFIQGIVNYRFYLYKGVWRFSSMPDLWNIFRASIIGVLCITLALFIVTRLEGIPRSIFILYPIFLIFFLGTPRLIYRYWKDSKYRNIHAKAGKKVLIIGAGSAGNMLVREMLRDDLYRPIGFIDDNKSIKDSELHRVPVLGTADDIKNVASAFNVEEIIIAIPSAENEQMQSILKHCEDTDLPIRTLPKLQDIVSNNSTLSNLREVTIEDLLGREKIELDWEGIQKEFANKTILVTGGGGSIGSELCSQIAKLAPSKLIIFERSEFNLYKIEKYLSNSSTSIEFILGDLCDLEKVKSVINKFSPEIIFHAAAYKHVPILERDAREGIRNNITGTKNIADIASENDCERFILISTDKAVNPTNVLGATKRIAEQYIEYINKTSKTNFITVRFGNVLGSDGSVVPLFKEQIKNGGPVTVTHPDITRYFMTIREASQLILQASRMGHGGEIFVLDMGEPVKINNLAEQLIRLSGLIPNKDINIEFSGLRPGEKMYEELFYENEIRETTSHQKILLAKHSINELKNINDKIGQIIESVNCFDNNHLKVLLNELAPTIERKEDKIISFNK